MQKFNQVLTQIITNRFLHNMSGVQSAIQEAKMEPSGGIKHIHVMI